MDLIDMTEGAEQLKAIFCTEEQNPELVDRLFCLRKEIFVDTLRWELQIQAGRERDEFDTDAALYCVLCRNGEPIAGFRAIRTDRPYLAQAIFPDLAVFASYPNRRDIWEISRFGVLPSEAGSTTARTLYALMFRLARRVRATSLVAVTDVRFERFLTFCGIRTRRYGPPRIFGRDEHGDPLFVVAGDIPVAQQSGRRFEALLNLEKIVEIDDEALVLRPSRLSA